MVVVTFWLMPRGQKSIDYIQAIGIAVITASVVFCVYLWLL
jgi:hypothetical protein